jgi:hypothetical protein
VINGGDEMWMRRGAKQIAERDLPAPIRNPSQILRSDPSGWGSRRRACLREEPSSTSFSTAQDDDNQRTRKDYFYAIKVRLALGSLPETRI